MLTSCLFMCFCPFYVLGYKLCLEAITILDLCLAILVSDIRKGVMPCPHGPQSVTCSFSLFICHVSLNILCSDAYKTFWESTILCNHLSLVSFLSPKLEAFRMFCYQLIHFADPHFICCVQIGHITGIIKINDNLPLTCFVKQLKNWEELCLKIFPPHQKALNKSSKNRINWKKNSDLPLSSLSHRPRPENERMILCQHIMTRKQNPGIANLTTSTGTVNAARR